MTNDQYKLIPLEKTLLIPVHWIFSQDDYENLIRGHRSNWCVFLRDEVVHFCRVGGEEFYRFSLKETIEGQYITSGLETYTHHDFNTSLKQCDRPDEEIERHEADFKRFAIEETTGLLNSYFGISIC